MEQDNNVLFHELKNYISYLNSNLQMYEQSHTDLSLDPNWSKTKQVSKRILTISTVLPLCDLSASFCPVKTDMKEFFHTLFLDFSATYLENFQMHLFLEPKLPTLFLDPVQLRMALNHMIDNSYDACNHKGDVFVKAFCEDHHLTILIKDYGCGISPKNLPHIFEEGFSTKPDALGFGLSLASTAIDLIHGSIQVKNNPINGTTFLLHIPIT